MKKMTRPFYNFFMENQPTLRCILFQIIQTNTTPNFGTCLNISTIYSAISEIWKIFSNGYLNYRWAFSPPPNGMIDLKKKVGQIRLEKASLLFLDQNYIIRPIFCLTP